MDDVDIIGDYVGVIMYIVTGNKLGVNLWLYHFYGSPFATYYYPIRNDNGQGYLSRKGGGRAIRWRAMCSFNGFLIRSHLYRSINKDALRLVEVVNGEG